MNIKTLHNRRTFLNGPSRGGSITVLILFCLTALLIFGVVVLNICWIHDCRAKLQATADSASLTAAQVLLSTGDRNTAIGLAQENAEQYSINNAAQNLAFNDFQFGSRVKNPNGSYSFLEGEFPLNSVKVIARRDGNGTGQISTHLSRFVGKEFVSLSRFSVASFADHDVAIVIDASGMMNGPGRFDGVKKLLGELLTVSQESMVRLRFSVTLFSKDAETVLPLSGNLVQVREAIDNIALRGPRALGDGMHLGLESLFDPKNGNGDTKKSLLILTECKSPKGLDPIAVAEIAKANNVDLDIFTFTKIADIATAQNIATASGGEHRHALTNSQLKQVLKQFIYDVPTFLIE